MNANYLRKVAFLSFAFLAYSVTLSAQSNPDSVANIQINSNYEFFYVLIDDNLESAKQVRSGEFFEIEPGDRAIRVIPEFSPEIEIRENFISDSVHILSINFREILKSPSDLFSKLLRNEPLPSVKKNLPGSNNFYRFDILSDSLFKARENSVTDKHSSYLKVNTNVDSLYISMLNKTRTTYKIANGDSLKIQPGVRVITLAHKKAEEIQYRRHFKDSTTIVLDHDFELSDPTVYTLTDNIATQPEYNSNLIVVSDEDSEIIINGEYYGFGATKVNMRTGPYEITIRNQYTGEHTQTGIILNNESDNAIVVDGYTKPVLGFARLLSVIPGTSQIYKRQKMKGYLLSSSFLLSGYFAIQKKQQYNSEFNIFNDLKEQYNNATNEQVALELGDQIERQQSVVKNQDNQRIALFSLTAIIYAFNIYDALTSKPEGGYRSNTDIDFYLNNEVVGNNRYTTLSMRYVF